MINITKIYLITNINGNPNKVYIGKTKNNRKNQHYLKFGKQITYDYIDEINSLNHKDWEPLETYWIEQFRQWGFEIINKRKKGGSGPEYQNEETKLKMRKPKSEETKQKMRGKSKPGNGPKGNRSIEVKNQIKLLNSKPVLQYNLNKDFIKEWSSQTEAALSLNKTNSAISECCRGIKKTAYGFIWKYKIN
jgi:hypothetical protein